MQLSLSIMYKGQGVSLGVVYNDLCIWLSIITVVFVVIIIIIIITTNRLHYKRRQACYSKNPEFESFPFVHNLHLTP